MRVDKKLLDHLASLSALELNEKEKKEFLPELADVLNAFSKLKEVNTKNV